MDSKGRGRGRGRKSEMRKPEGAAVERIRQEQEQAAANKSGLQSPTLSEQMANPPDEGTTDAAKIEDCSEMRKPRIQEQAAASNSGSQSLTLPEKMADPPDEGTADAAKIKEPDVAAELAQSPTTSQTQQTIDSPADTAMTTTGEGRCPPLAADLKKTVQRGVEVSTQSYPATVTISTIKLNPSAANFVPKATSLDPRSSVFTPSTTTLLPTATTPSPIFNKHSIPSSTSSQSSSRLDPASKEFVPSENLTPPLPMANGGPESLENGDFFDEDFGGYLSVKDIMLRYEKVAPVEESGEPVLKSAAEMLLKVYNYPGSFDEIGKKFQTTMANWVPSMSTLTNLAEMLVYWGVSMPDLRYAACKMSEMIVNIDPGELKGIGTNFSKELIKRLQLWHIKCYDKKHYTEQEKYAFAYYSGFFAEIFAKIRPGDQPVAVMYQFIFKYVEALLGMREDYFIREACNILKLTGNTLVSVDCHDESKLTAVITKMNDLALDPSLGDTSASLLMQVVELSGSKWCSSAAPVQPMMSEAPIKKAGLNTNAVPFVPSDPMLFSETFYDPPIIQPPVSCVADWDDFVGDDHSMEGSNNSPDVVEEEDDYDGLDPDIELEMEAFIDEIEEHLMLQDFDPEDTKPDGKH